MCDFGIRKFFHFFPERLINHSSMKPKGLNMNNTLQSITLSFTKYKRMIKMEIHPEELKIVDLFRKHPLSEFTLSRIMQLLKKNSYSWTYKAVHKLSKGVLKIKAAGKTSTVSLDLGSPHTVTLLAYLDRKEAYEKEIPLVNDLIASISKKTPYFTLLVAGSRAKGTERSGSDVDIAIIVEDEAKKKAIKPYISEATRLSGVKADIQLISKDEFYRMLLSDEENLGKEIFRHHLLPYGTEAYYHIIWEASRNGLQSKI